MTVKAGDRTEQILEIKQRNLRGHGFLSYDLQALQNKWLKSKNNTERTPDFYIIRAVTILEVFARRNIASLIDHSEHYTQRAVELSKHFKMDFDLVRHIQGRAITLGDIVAHSVPANSFAQIVGYFETLLGKQLRPLLTQAVDRWAVEIERKPREPIIHDFEKLAKRLTRLFELRHILCHELPSRQLYAETEIDELLDDTIQFATALQEVLTFERFGLTPLTQTEMNIAASESLGKTEERMSTLLSQIKSYVTHNDYGAEVLPPSKGEGTWLSCLDDAQEKWLLYRNAQCEFETYLNRGGTIRSMIWSGVAEKLTKDRIAELQSSWDYISQT
jgi:uncharacterized protein YecT (DUF1311 family)